MAEFGMPTLKDVFRAEKRLRNFFPPSPLLSFDEEGRRLRCNLHLKLENFLPTRSFKVRGATYLISSLSHEERENGVIVASTGNFAQGVAYAAAASGTRATVVMPENSNQNKVDETINLGGKVIFSGKKFDDARKQAEMMAAEKGYRYIHSANEPMLVAGVATHTLELLRDAPDIDTIIVPVGGGSGASGACISAKGVDSSIKVIGVQSESSPAAYKAWRSGRDEKAENGTFAEGLATGESYSYTQKIMREKLDDFILVSDDEIRDSMRAIFNGTNMLVESASASAFAAARKLGKQLEGRNVAMIITGGNVGPGQFRDIICR